ncbi:DUF2726 domain-containing protein [Gammaproteobacteria bacterium]|nr:DUF2726 domain-containing protein [Gammaproteobacteria bacterium]
MSSLVGLAVLVMIGAVVLAVLKKLVGGQSAPNENDYRREAYLLSKAELSFFGVLKMAVGDNSVVYPKVRVADVLKPAKGQGRSEWQRAFNRISAKHFDFIICGANGSTIQLAVELDDASHNSPKRVKRDEFLESACKSAGFPLIRIKAARAYAVADLQEQLSEVIASPSSKPNELLAADVSDDGPIAVDSGYRLRDNQFWYSDCSFADLIRDESFVEVQIEGLGVRRLAHSVAGKDGRSTFSFKLPTTQDRQWWKHNRGKHVRLELLSVG